MTDTQYSGLTSIAVDGRLGELVAEFVVREQTMRALAEDNVAYLAEWKIQQGLAMRIAGLVALRSEAVPS